MGRLNDTEESLQKRRDALREAWAQTAQLYAKTRRLPEACPLVDRGARRDDPWRRGNCGGAGGSFHIRVVS